jgi:hypothetical protein
VESAEVSERYKPRKLVRERIAHDPGQTFEPFEAQPRDQIVYRDGKPVVLKPILCRLHDQPWQTCTLCSKQKR